MGIGTSIFQLATIPWMWMEIALLVGLLVLTLIRAVQKSEVGYENESGFHYGNSEDAGRKISRSARPLPLVEAHSCHHSRMRENKNPGRHLRSKAK